MNLRADIRDLIPPTDNNIYESYPGRPGRHLTTEARAFKRRFTAAVVRAWGPDIMSLNPKGIYEVSIVHYVDSAQFFNKTYGQPKGAKTRIKKRDATNRIKLIGDALKDAIGIDDSQFLLTHAGRFPSAVPRLELELWELGEEVLDAERNVPP